MIRALSLASLTSTTTTHGLWYSSNMMVTVHTRTFVLLFSVPRMFLYSYVPESSYIRTCSQLCVAQRCHSLNLCWMGEYIFPNPSFKSGWFQADVWKTASPTGKVWHCSPALLDKRESKSSWENLKPAEHRGVNFSPKRPDSKCFMLLGPHGLYSSYSTLSC